MKKIVLQKKLNIKKVTRFTVAINAMQIATMVAVLLYVVLNDRAADRYVEIGVLCLTFLIVAWGAILDIKDAFSAQKIADQAHMLEEAYGQLEDLNGTLRRQRHDFMNHLQVVFSLMEMREYAEAMKYVESVYGDIQRTGSVLKTAIPAVNALIAAKREDCAEDGIRLETEIASGWQDLPVSGWEMCRVLGNLIDNARDALLESVDVQDRKILISIDETPGAFLFRVSNNGPAIPPEIQENIFEMGFTTKSEGHGSGLSIVAEIMDAYGGSVVLESTPSSTSFSGSIPKRASMPGRET